MSGARPSLLVPALVTFAGLAVLLSLGTWQLERKGWKEGLIAALNERTNVPPVELPPPSEWNKLTPERDEFRRVRLRVDFQGQDALLYTGGSALRDDVKSPGYFVFSAGLLPDGSRVVVNRGYTRDRTHAVPRGPMDIVGALRWPEGSSWVVADRDAADVWHVRNHLIMGAQRGWERTAPFYIEQESPVPPGGVPHPSRLKVNLPNNHLQYAATWYALALVLLTVFAVWWIQRRRAADPGSPPGEPK